MTTSDQLIPAPDRRRGPDPRLARTGLGGARAEPGRPDRASQAGSGSGPGSGLDLVGQGRADHAWVRVKE